MIQHKILEKPDLGSLSKIFHEKSSKKENNLALLPSGYTGHNASTTAFELTVPVPAAIKCGTGT